MRDDCGRHADTRAEPDLAPHRVRGGLGWTACDARPRRHGAAPAPARASRPVEPLAAAMGRVAALRPSAGDAADRRGALLRRELLLLVVVVTVVVVALAVELGQVLDALAGAPLGVVVLHRLDQLLHEAGRQVDAGDHHARYLLLLDLVVDPGEVDGEL